MDYKNSKIYRIVCNETGLCYVGSTTSTLTKRLSNHKSKYKLFLEKETNYISSFSIIEKGNYDIVLIEEYPCENKQQLHARERYYIETMECVNKNIPNKNKKERYEENKDKILEKRYEYYQDNREHILNQKKEYLEKNREEINKRRRESLEKRKEEVNRKRREKYHLSKI